MKLVYLDTSNLSLLAETRQKFPEKFHSFLTNWRKQKYILALSEAHIFETTRLDLAATKQARYDLFKEMLPIRFEAEPFSKEIVSALKRKGIYNYFLRDFRFYKLMFLEVKCLANHISALYSNAENNYYSILVSQSYETAKVLWQDRKLYPKNKNQKVERLRDLPESFPDNFKDFFDTILQASEKLSEINPFATDEIKFLDSRAVEAGFRQAYAEMMGVDITSNSYLNTRTDYLTDKLAFKVRLKFFLSQILYDDEKNINFLSSKILIEDCPGEWLKRQVENQLCMGDDFDHRNQLDIQHISYLPYVDILITDKRIVSKTEQVFRRQNSLLDSLNNTSLPKKVSNSMDSLENALFN